MLATYASSDTCFDLTDWQGTKRAQSSVVGCLTGWASLPYGNGTPTFGDPTAVSIGPTPACGADATEHHYTGKEHDFETGNDDFGARYFEDVTGRWLSPDWAAAAEAVPYASYGSPQTLNLYAFVGNNPLSQVDADGHDFYRVSCSDGSAGQCGVGAYPGSEGIFTADLIRFGCAGPDDRSCMAGSDQGFVWQQSTYDNNGEIIGSDAVSPSAGPDMLAAPTVSEAEQAQKIDPLTGLPMPTECSCGDKEKKEEDGNKKGGGRNAQKSNPDKQTSAEKKLQEVKKELNEAKQSPPSKGRSERIRNLQRLVKHWQEKAAEESENHSRQGKGQQK